MCEMVLGYLSIHDFWFIYVNFLSYWFSFSSFLFSTFARCNFILWNWHWCFFYFVNDNKKIIFRLGSVKRHAVTLLKIIFCRTKWWKKLCDEILYWFGRGCFVCFLFASCVFYSLFFVYEMGCKLCLGKFLNEVLVCNIKNPCVSWFWDTSLFMISNLSIFTLLEKFWWKTKKVIRPNQSQPRKSFFF